MSILKAEDKNKWISFFLVVVSSISAFVFIKFFEQLSEWFDLEAKIGNFEMLSQGLGIALGAVVFFVVLKNKQASDYLNEVYNELTKVVWSEKDTAFKLTIGIVIAVAILSLIFVGFDVMFQKGLELIY
ncbi:MAG: preprotein translocase subunit SecE [Bacteriovoracaceae bacterium]